MLKDAVVSRIKSLSAKEFCRTHLFDMHSWYFENARDFGATGTYDQFRVQVGGLVDCNPNNVAIVGSAKFGFSLAPDKRLRDFEQSSDIDLVIASPKLFEDTWAQFRVAFYNGYGSIQKKHSAQVFQKHIVLSGEDFYHTTYLRKLALQLSQMKRDIGEKFQIPNRINYRIYPSWDDVENYHIHSTEKLRESLP